MDWQLVASYFTVKFTDTFCSVGRRLTRLACSIGMAPHPSNVVVRPIHLKMKHENLLNQLANLDETLCIALLGKESDS